MVGIMIASALLCGCAISQDVVGFASRAIDSNQILIIGTTGPLRKPGEKQREELYNAYVKSAARRLPGAPPALSAAAFDEKLAGWASIQTSGVPLMSWSPTVLVSSAALLQDTGFASAAGDLVAARTDPDGLVWVDRVLCRSGEGFKDCAKKYQTGIFDESSGRELARDRKPKVDGALVDVTSYVSLAADPARHTASELDPRALNRCDGCKGSLPASTQSVVPVP